MAYIKEYWEGKQERAEQARKHTAKMRDEYSEEILSSCRNSTIQESGFLGRRETKGEMKVCVLDMDTVEAAAKFRDAGKVALLNFASYTEPGGKFLEGSRAQEESLCHSSFLYNVLLYFYDSFYMKNRDDKNRALYKDRSLYSPGVRFWWNGETFCCDVITCAAPNRSAAKQYCHVTEDENWKALQARAEHVLGVAEVKQVNTLILGAWGCGVFGQSSLSVAMIFSKLLSTEYRAFDRVVFAIPKGRDRNLEAFQAVFREWKS